MNINKSSNPALNGLDYVHPSSHYSNHQVMSAQGAYNKSLLLLVILVISGILSVLFIPSQLVTIAFFGSMILGLILALVLSFKQNLAPMLAPIYAVVEGIFLGLVSYIFEMMYPGIITQAILITVLIAFLMNTLYKHKIIKVTEKFRSIIVLSTLGIFGIYVISFLLSFTSYQIPLIHESGLVGIGFSLFVVTIASLNLLLDYDFIEKSSKQKLPKYMEWYGAFALTVTLVWLYLEILKLLTKLKQR